MPVKVVLIAGYGRSGSTLLDRMLGRTSGWFSAGELRHIWQEGFRENRLCGCGEPFLDCAMWRDVTRVMLDSSGPPDVSDILRVKDHVDHFYRIPQIVTGTGSKSYRRDLSSHRSLLADLYRAIGSVSGADVIIDSSKDVSHGYLLSTLDDIDLHVIHLVRDSRAVAHSWRRLRHNRGSGTDMARFNPFKTAVEWNAVNALAAGLRRRAKTYRLVRYENLVANPDPILSEIAVATRSLVPPALPNGDEIDLRPTHTVAGNPNRFKHGRIKIRADDEWREQMAAPARVMVGAITAPLLWRYGREPTGAGGP